MGGRAATSLAGTPIAAFRRMSNAPAVSESFQVFVSQCPEISRIWMDTAQKLSGAHHLDPKTKALCYLSALAAARLSSGVPFHAAMARSAGATREEVTSAVLIGLPAVGNAVLESLPAALQAFED